MPNDSRYANRTHPLLTQLNHSVATALAFLFFVHIGFAQDKHFKKELFDRGLEKLRQLKTHHRLDLSNAFEAACSIDSEKLADDFVSEFKISRSDAFLLAVDYAESLPDSKLFLRYLPKENFVNQHRDAFAETAFILGTRNEDFATLINACRSFLVTRDIEDDISGEKEKLSDEVIRKRRTEFLRFQYNLGRLQNEENLEPLENALQGINGQLAKKYLRAAWLVNIGTKVLSGAEQLEAVNKFESQDFAVRVLYDLLMKSNRDQLQSMVGDSMVSKMVELYLDPGRNPEETENFLVELEEKYTHRDFFRRLFQSPSPKQIIELAKHTRSYNNELDILELITFVTEKNKDQPETVSNLGKSLMESCLTSGNLDDAKTIAKRLTLELSSRSVFDYSIQQGDLETAKQIVKSNLDDKSVRNMTVLASVLLSKGRDAEATDYVQRLENDFRQRLEKQPVDKRAKWIVEFVMTCGWSSRSIQIDRLPLEDAILKEFEPFVETPAINESISRCIGSFTPPTLASKKLLLKMMKMLPESKQITTSFEENNLIDKILAEPKTDFAKLREQALKLTNRSESMYKNVRASRFAYSFAFAGDMEGVNKLIDQVSIAENQAWVLFQCARAYPPRRVPIDKRHYSGRSGGGLF